MIIIVDVAEDGEAPLEIAVGSVLRERLSMASYLFAAAASPSSRRCIAHRHLHRARRDWWFVPDRRVEKEVEKAVEAEGDGSIDP